MGADKLTPKQEAFSVAYAKGATGADAYKGAYSAKGMTPNAIYVEASRLLDNPKVALRIEKLRAPVLKRHEASVERSMEEVVAAAYGQVDEPLTHAAKLKALEMLFKHFGLFERDNSQKQPNLALQINLVGAPTPTDITPRRTD